MSASVGGGRRWNTWNVVRLDVAVHDPLTMGVVETVGDLRQDATCLFLGDPPVAAKPVGKRFAAHIPHHEVGHAFHFAERVKRDDVRVRQSRRRARFASESLVHGPLVRSGFDDLDGHLALEGKIARQVDSPHPAPPEQPDQAVLRSELRLERPAQRITFVFGALPLSPDRPGKDPGGHRVRFRFRNWDRLAGPYHSSYLCIKERLSMVAQGLQQKVHLVVDVLRRFDRIGNAPPQGVAVANAETVDG